MGDERDRRADDAHPGLRPGDRRASISTAGWRWIFLINLPAGAAAVLAARRLLPDAWPQLSQRLDLRGLLLCPGIAVFLYGMARASNRGGFVSSHTIIAALAGLR